MSHSDHDFDRVIDRRGSSSTKWQKFAPDVLPFWVADMDFRAPSFVLAAIDQRVRHGIIGYTDVPASLNAAFCSWLERQHGWRCDADWLVWIPGVVAGLNLAALSAVPASGRLVIPTPVYYPFLELSEHSGREAVLVPHVQDEQGRWALDYERLRTILKPGDGLFLSHPQNPLGRVLGDAELRTLATLCREREVALVSDEIHSAIVLSDDVEHQPIAPYLEADLGRTISLYAPTKTYNVPGLPCAVAVIPDADLRDRFKAARRGLVGSPSPLAYAACEAAFRDESDWVPALLDYLRGNLARLRAVAGTRLGTVEATYLAWLDVRDLNLAEPLAHFAHFGLGLSDGAQFAGPGYVRFNFAAPRATLDAGLERLSRALLIPESG